MKEEQNESYSHVLKYTGIFGGVQGLNMLVSLVRNKLVALLLGPSGMGLTTLFNTAVNFIYQATNLGISFSAVRHLSELFDQGDEQRIAGFIKVVRGWCLLTALIGMLVCVALGPFLSANTFAWGNHTLHFVLLAPAIGMITVTGGETAILKGTHRLGALAVIQVLSVVASLFITIPVYYFFGEAGIVPVIVMMAGATLCLTLRRSYRFYPLRLTDIKGILGEGMEMVRLGVAFTLAGIVGSASEMIIRSFLNVEGDLDIVGFYNVGYMITITYAGMVFSAMESDYFPRLSAVNHDFGATNETVNKQMEVTLLIIAPMMAALIVALPVLVPLLFSTKFLPVISMAQVTALAMYFKVMTLPVGYITLARGYSLVYLGLELAYFVVFVLLVVVGYNCWGLYGTGLAITLANVFDCLMVHAVAYTHFKYRITVTVMRYASVQLSLGLLVYAVTLSADSVFYWSAGIVLVLLSASYSLKILHSKTRLWESLTRRFRRH